MRELGISYGRSCYARMWANDTISFVPLIDRLRDPVRTPETQSRSTGSSRATRSRRRRTKADSSADVLHGTEGGDILQQPRRLLSDKHRSQRRADLHPLHALGLRLHLMEGRTVHIQHTEEEHRQLNPRVDKGSVNRRESFRQDPGVAPLVVYMNKGHLTSGGR